MIEHARGLAERKPPLSEQLAFIQQSLEILKEKKKKRQFKTSKPREVKW